jgi:hypothetical protein
VSLVSRSAGFVLRMRVSFSITSSAGTADKSRIRCQQMYQRCQRVPTEARERAHFVVDLSL